MIHAVERIENIQCIIAAEKKLASDLEPLVVNADDLKDELRLIQNWLDDLEGPMFLGKLMSKPHEEQDTVVVLSAAEKMLAITVQKRQLLQTTVQDAIAKYGPNFVTISG